MDSWISLDGNKIGCNGARSLSEVLESNASLQLLDISRNTIQDDGGKAIAAVLSKNAQIHIRLL